ncbi:hypothetical protein [Corynebacterium sp.]|uniref:hypothetical protein n=1 Tax=Corynebacterium sp. TaxID=1720 RepID=UPI003B3BBC3E
MKPLTYPEIAATVLSEARAIYPTAMKPDPATVDAWARIFARSHLQVPATVWREAVTTWAVSHGDPPTPHDLVATAKQVIAQWEAHPEHKQALAAHRRRVLEAKFGAGYGAQHAGQVDQTTGDALEAPRQQTRTRWAEVKAEISARARERRVAERQQADEVRARLDVTEPSGEGAPG